MSDDEQLPPGVIRIPDEYGADEALAMAEALAHLDGADQKIRYLEALNVVAKNYPPEMTEEDRAVCNAAKAHLFEAAYETGDYLVEALRHCTPAERGWCMWLDLTACSVESRLSED